jgi:hypothetical protein
MSDFSDPDGKSRPINNLIAQYLTVPAYATAFLSGFSNAAWEQAVVVYIDGNRQGTQMGTFNRTGLMWLSTKDRSQQVMVAGWHKRSGPDAEQPWQASRGRTLGNVASWDDSGGDNDFNDYRVELVVLPGLHTPRSFHSDSLSGLSSTEADPLQIALVLTSLANLKETAMLLPAGETKEALERYVHRLTSEVIERHCSTTQQPVSWPPPLSQNVILAAELNLIAHTFQEGDLRTESLRLARQVLQRANDGRGNVDQ